ncbi:hypothetical protein MUK42_32902 [Musa troglodytarum]|uniref:Uncharacterized protein n=1 Tax=Musa troglodytarum TaxID=320322 RepID=A0A9E7GKX9_9LILI|nr:hypothetical protein MUK42_32902 [Musa troglodytarum]
MEFLIIQEKAIKGSQGLAWGIKVTQNSQGDCLIQSPFGGMAIDGCAIYRDQISLRVVFPKEVGGGENSQRENTRNENEQAESIIQLRVDKLDREDPRTGKEQDESVVIKVKLML